ncbi:13390_t:CDS:2 [Entrophospora sp. SA101]|nr:13390_t:CDS:2 [Entrophospora sp. SA101]
MDDLIAEIKDYEDTDDLLTAKRIEDTKSMYTLKPPLKTKCFECQKGITVKFCPPRQEYSQKNNWGY